MWRLSEIVGENSGTVLPERVVHLVKREIDQTVVPHVDMAA